MTRQLMEGSEAIAGAMVAAGCRFFSGYPMTPFTEVLEHMAKLLPGVGGVCMNAESELEAVGMAWGAASTGTRSATGSVGQGLSLMQESLSEICHARLPLVVLNMARGQGDYYQATRGGGHGDYRHIVLAPHDISEGVALVQLAFHLADKWRNPVLIYGDYLLAHTQEAVAVETIPYPALPPKDWAVDGGSSGSGQSHSVTPLGVSKHGQAAFGQEGRAQYGASKIPYMEREVRVETAFLDDAETVIVAFGTPSKFVRYAIGRLREAGHKIGMIRPITLWPFPYDTVRAAAAAGNVRMIGSFELCAGQMVDDVRIGAAGQVPVEFIGGVSTDSSGFGVGRLLDVDVIQARILALHTGQPLDVIPGSDVYRYELAPHQEEPTP